MSRAWPLAVTALALGGCLDFAPPPAPVAADTVSASCRAGSCAVGQRCLDLGQQAPEQAPCQVCGPDDALIPCPFACDDGRCAAVVDLAAGNEHACVSLDTGAVWCWGAHDTGAIGDGVVALDETTPVPSAWTGPTDALEAGRNFTCVLGDGDVYCWGGNDFGQAGRPPSPAEPAPGRVTLPGRAVALADVYGDTPCAVLEDGGVWCWGFAIDGRSWLSGGDGAGASVPAEIPTVAGAETIVSTGSDNACALVPGAGLHCWGDGGEGALGLGGREDHAEPQAVTALPDEPLATVAAGDASACALTKRGEAWCWGANAAGQTGRPENEGEVVSEPTPLAEPPQEALSQLSLGFRHACALGASDRVFCWGLRTQGQCGATFLNASHVAAPVPGLPPAARVVAGGLFTCALGRDDGLVWCFGRADRGELGAAGITAPSVALPVLVHRGTAR